MCFCGLTDKCVEDLSTGLNNYIQRLNIAYNDSITEDGLNVLVRRLITLSGMRQLTIPSHLVSSITPVLNDVNEERRRNGLPEIKLIGGCNCLFINVRLVTSDFDHEFTEAVHVLTSYVLMSIWLIPNSCDVCKCVCGHPIVISNFFGYTI